MVNNNMKNYQTEKLEEETDKNMKKWILLDNQATSNLFGNRNIVENIRKADEKTTICGTRGELVRKMIADLGEIVTCTFHYKAMTNIVSLAEVVKTLGDL